MSSSIRVSIAVLLAAVACAADAPKRIISASPNVTEILYGVGAFDRVIAVSDYCTYPPVAGVDLQQAVRLASLNPARALNISRGVLQAGQPADLVVLSPSGEVKATIVNGVVAQ